MRLTAPPRVTLLNVLRYAKIKVHKVGFDRRRRPPAAAAAALIILLKII